MHGSYGRGKGYPVTIHFFTIVLNGRKFLPHHERLMGCLDKMNVPYRWVFVEGYALPVKDTAWCKPLGDKWVRHGVSTDGTWEFLTDMGLHNLKVTHWSKSEPWEGKVQMCNAALTGVQDGDIVFQVDVDELWNPSQIFRIYRAFQTEPALDAMRFFCRYYVSPSFRLMGYGGYGNKREQEWDRVWRYHSGMQWVAHEPPIWNRKPQLVLSQDQTASLGLVFRHYAYADKETIQFKEDYYGRPDGLSQWEDFQAACRGNEYLPTIPRPIFPWVGDDSMAKEDIPLDSYLKGGIEQGPDSYVLHIVYHLGLGDALICRGIVLDKVRRWGAVVVYAAPNYRDVIQFLYDCDPETRGVVFVRSARTYEEAIHLANDSQDAEDVLILGFHDPSFAHDKRGSLTFDQMFYRQAGTTTGFRFSPLPPAFFAHPPSEKETADSYGGSEAKQGERVIVCHEDTRRGYVLDRSRIPESNKVWIRPEGSWLDWARLIAGCDEFHGIDSSFLNFATLLPVAYRPKRVVLHRYARPTLDRVSVPDWVDCVE